MDENCGNLDCFDVLEGNMYERLELWETFVVQVSNILVDDI